MSVSIELDRGEYMPGDTIKAVIKLDLDKPVQARGVFASLVCSEKRKKTYSRTMSHDEASYQRSLGLYVAAHNIGEETRIEDHTTFNKEKRLAGESSYQKEEFSVEFQLPGNAASTSHVLGHDNKIVKWTLSAKVDIPWAPDAGSSVEVKVGGL